MPETTVATAVCIVGSSTSASTAPAMSAEAPPPNAFSNATIWGIAVIWILSASVTPITEPSRTPARISANSCVPAPST